MIRDAHQHNENVTPNDFAIERLRAALPEYFDKEGNFMLDRLQENLQNGDVNLTKEGYELKFLGKSYAKYLTSTETETVVVPDLEHNAEPENRESENLYIVGDNLDALKHLLGSYTGQVKCIYIDPPYNTGSDGFVYNDDFGFTPAQLVDKIGLSEDEAERVLDLQGKSSHSAWLTFMYPRLQLAKELLADDGVIFISIDDNEGGNLRLLGDDIFGEQNRVSSLAWNVGAGTQAGHFTRAVESVLVYARNIHSLPFFKGGAGLIEDRATKKISSKNPASEINFPAGFPWHAPDGTTLSGTWGGNEQITLVSGHMEAKDGALLSSVTLSAGWSMANQIKQWVAGKDTKDSKGQSVVGFYFNRSGGLRYVKEKSTVHPSQLLTGIGTTKDGSTEVEDLFGASVFGFPKPTKLIKFLVSLMTVNGDLVLDFFSGSASTADAVMQLNAEDGGHRKFIMVQLPEKIEPDKPAFHAGYHTIDEIGRERIKRAAAKIKDETGADIDYGFKLYRLEEPSGLVLDQLERFDPENSDALFSGDYVSKFDLNGTPGHDTVLATWLVKDGFGLTASTRKVKLEVYELDVCGDSGYIIDTGLTSGDVVELVRQLETGELDVTRVVVFGYSVEFSVMHELKKNLAVLKSDKTVDVIERF
ncbi:MAG: DNA methyltransferase [Mobiluncus porci]|uniref:site-specific DNA-methyltransferase n=1 Tax=Mobiluncus porci TaxID=2652278 RepID=UPI0023F31CF3|nr:site-specific DNA-methyltransferase [Mobiluncus porci]MDD7541126.1 DNA methyltransferase [Mobiluncus porci]MDY5748014.1 DNA methyltransferase [Mobiluncus porci]